MSLEPIPAALVFSENAKKKAIAAAKTYTDTVIAALPKGIVYKGAVNYYNLLPASGASEGDCYTVKYSGTSGTEPDGTEYIWGSYEGTFQWISLGGGMIENVYTKAEADEKFAEKDDDAVANHICIFDADGNPVDSGHGLSEYVKCGFVSVTITATDSQTPTSASGVSVELVRDGTVVSTLVYNGQPVQFGDLVPGLVYVVRPTGAWAGHYRPTPSSYSFTAVAGATTSVTITYASMTVPESLSDLADIVQNGGAQNLTIGTQFNITWTDTATNTEYQVPVDIVSVQNVEDENGVTHEAAIIQWHYGTPFDIQFDAPEVVTATEATASSGMYYYGKTGHNYTLLQLSAGDTIPYGDYDAVYKNEIKDTSFNILSYGYNRYRDSAWRQFLCSEDGVGEWWAATHVGDVAPSQLNSRAGFLSGFSAADLALMKKSKITCYTNNVTDGSVIDTMYDKWFLASGTEMYGSVNANEGAYFPYWKSATGLASPSNNANAGRIAYRLNNHASSMWHWLRSPYRSYSYIVWRVSTSGDLNYGTANTSYGALPACAIY